MNAAVTQQQFDALAQLLKAKEGSDSYRVAKLVLVEGKTIGDAAREVGTTYNAAHQSARRYAQGLELARAAANG